MLNKATGNSTRWRRALVLLLTLCTAGLAQADLVVKADRQEISDADVLRLSVRLENTSISATPDFSGIERDFEILNIAGPSRYSSTSIINGRTSVTSSVTWELSLRALRTGELNIPALRLGGDRSDPVTINVTPQTAATRRQASQYVFFDTGVDTNTTYVQGQIIYTVKLHYVDAVGGDFPPPPNIEDAVVETIGEERRFDTVVNNRRYYVLEKRYAIYPQRSGTLTIPRETFVGTRGRSSLSYGSDRVMAFSENHKITVKPKPAAFTDANWLPARNVTLTDSWKMAPPDFVVGEPVNRTLTLTAEGVAGALLPSLPEPQISGAKLYADPADISELPTPMGLTATQVQSLGIVPTQPGIIEFPAVTVRWWNTQTDSPAEATLAAERFVVAGAPATVTMPTVPPSADTATIPSATTGDAQPATSLWTPVGWSLAVVFAVLWLLTLRAWGRSTHSGAALRPSHSMADKDSTEATAFRALEAACHQQDLTAIRRALLHWGQIHSPHCPSLHDLGKHLDSLSPAASNASDNDFAEHATIGQCIAALEQALYAPPGEKELATDWQPDALVKALRKARKPGATAVQQDRVPALNPV